MFKHKEERHYYSNISGNYTKDDNIIRNLFRKKVIKNNAPDQKKKTYIRNAGVKSIGTLLLLALLLISWTCTQLVKASATDNRNIQEGIAGEIIRFHVIANSDSREDQELKFKVKEELIAGLAPYLKEVKSISESREILLSRLTDIKEAAEAFIHESGFDYPVAVSLEKSYFPVKIYGDYTFPAGYYEALRVKIGKAEGQNWWCVMFPPLCFVDETYSIVDEETDGQLKYLLTEEEYESLRGKKVPVKVRFKLWEAIRNLFKS